MRKLTIDQARRISLAAQGFTDPRPTGRIDVRHFRRVVDRIGLVKAPGLLQDLSNEGAACAS